jgi:hypothetical protein
MNLSSAFSALPRAGRWAVAGSLVLIAYFAAVEPGLETLNRLSVSADKRRLELAAFSTDQRTGDDTAAAVALGISRYGEVAMPGDEETRIDAFNRRIADVLSRHGVKDQKATARRASLPKGPLLSALGAGAAITRHTSDLTFEATPEQISGIIADLEKTPEVAAVSRVQLRRVDEQERARLLRANISVETWFTARRGGQQ